MRLARVAFAAIGVIASSVALSTTAVFADDWPSKPITMIVPYNPGGTTDNLARLAAEAISDAVGQPVVIENKPGAAGVVGATLAAGAPNDGYTLFFGNNATNVVQPLINPALQYDPIANFDGIATTAEGVPVLGVNADLGINTMKEFIAYLKENPNTKYGTAGVGSMGQFTTNYLLRQTGTTAKHIPYEGSNNAVTAVMSGELEFMTDPVVSRHLDSGKINALAILCDRRHPNFPEVPTAQEAGFDIILSGWFGLWAPKGTDPEIIQDVSKAIGDMVASDAYQDHVLKMGLLPYYRDVKATNVAVSEAIKTFSEIRDAAGIKIN